MSIKNLKPSKKSRTHQGYFNISESTKYIGKDKKVIYRSSWELMFCKWAESNTNVAKWASEAVAIKYHCPIDNKTKKYYPDFFVRFKNGDTWIVEVKPFKEYGEKPQKPKRRTKNTVANYNYLKKCYIVNTAKFKSARNMCKLNGWAFFVADEKWFKFK